MSDGYEVGYKKPPRAHQFKPGNQAAKGPKRKRKEGISIPEVLRKAISTRRQIKRGGEIVSMQVADILSERLVQAIVTGSAKEIAIIVALLDRYLPEVLAGEAETLEVTYHRAEGSKVPLPPCGPVEGDQAVILKLPHWAEWLDALVNDKGEPVRHRVLHGGRGAAKSWTITHKLVELARRFGLRILCAREFQNSIRDSSKKLIEDSIDRMGFGPNGDQFFKITDREIRGRNGSLFTFIGLNGRDQAIKSLESYDIAWVEEAATVSQSSIDALIPTIRR